MMDSLYKLMLGPNRYIKHLKKLGCKIGDDVSLYKPLSSITIDITRPWLINIGNHVRITRGVTILTHDYGWSVLKVLFGEIYGSAKKTTIGDNVFIGVNTTITGGVTVGNNVIIGANSLVSKDIPDNVVIAGNPAKIICTIDEYASKRKSKQKEEAVNLAISYFETYKKWPPKSIMREFVWLFEDRGKETDTDAVFSEIGSLGENFEQTKSQFHRSRGAFKNYDDFIVFCKKEHCKNSTGTEK